MIRPLLVAVAHGMDLLTFLVAAALHGVQGEGNGLMQSAYLQLGPLGVVALKGSGTAALSFIVALRPRMVVLAAGAGIAGAIVNLIAINL